MSSDSERVTSLEVLAAEQERTIAELSTQLVEQWTAMEAMRRKLDALTDRFLALEERTAPAVPVDKPPHW